MKLKKFFFVSVCIAALLFVMSGCSPPGPVQYITILKLPPSGHPSTGGWGLYPGIEPYPTHVQETFQPSEPLILGLKLDERFKRSITFSNYTFFNTKTMESVIISSPGDLGPFELGQVFELQYSAPSEPGDYELRIYYEEKLVASALFKVEIEPK